MVRRSVEDLSVGRWSVVGRTVKNLSEGRWSVFGGWWVGGGPIDGSGFFFFSLYLTSKY